MEVPLIKKDSCQSFTSAKKKSQYPLDLQLILSPKQSVIDIYDELVKQITPKKQVDYVSADCSQTPEIILGKFEGEQSGNYYKQNINDSIYSQKNNTIKKQAMILSNLVYNFQQEVKSIKKGCHCQKSKCLKNYCECYKEGINCSQSCQCLDCKNIQIRDVSKNIPTKCNCKKSQCVKKYCQCHSAGRKCSEQCRCIECLNDVQKDQPYSSKGNKKVKLDGLTLETSHQCL